MIKGTYVYLLRFSPLRCFFRRFRARLQSVAGYLDSFYDLAPQVEHAVVS